MPKMPDGKSVKDGGRNPRPQRSRSRGEPIGSEVDHVRLPRKIMGLIIGKAGATIKNIREVSNARIDVEDKNDDVCELKLQGTDEQVAKAKKMILEVAEKTPSGSKAIGEEAAAAGDGSGITESVEYPGTIMGRIIGPKGSKIQEVRQGSGARITVEKENDKCQVCIAGTQEQVDKAKALVQEVADEELAKEGTNSTEVPAAGGENEVATIDEPVTDIMQFPSIVTGKLIGSRGSQIADIRKESGAKVSVEKGEEFCKVHISGTQEQVDSARKIARDLAEEGLMGTPRDGQITDNMEVPHSMVGRVIGRGGDTIQRLQRESGARIRVNANEGDPCVIRIQGTKDSCARARFMVADVIDRGNNFGEGDMDRGASSFARLPPPPPAPWGMPYPTPGYGGAFPPSGSSQGRSEPRSKQYEAPKRLDIDLDEL